MLEKRKKTGILKVGQVRSGGVVISQKQGAHMIAHHFRIHLRYLCFSCSERSSAQQLDAVASDDRGSAVGRRSPARLDPRQEPRLGTPEECQQVAHSCNS